MNKANISLEEAIAQIEAATGCPFFPTKTIEPEVDAKEDKLVSLNEVIKLIREDAALLRPTPPRIDTGKQFAADWLENLAETLEEYFSEGN